MSEDTLREAARSGFSVERLDEKAMFALQVDDVLLAATGDVFPAWLRMALFGVFA